MTTVESILRTKVMAAVMLKVKYAVIVMSEASMIVVHSMVSVISYASMVTE